MPRDENENDRQGAREHRAQIEKAKMAAQDRRADAAVRFHNRRSAIDAAASALGQGATAKQITDLAQELLAWIEKE